MNPKKIYSKNGAYVPPVYIPDRTPKKLPDAVKPDQKPHSKKKTVFRVIRRSLLVVLTLVLLSVYAVFALVHTVANGPSPTVRNLLVLSALQASATKWIPGLFLDDETVDQILADSKVISTDVLSLDEYAASQQNNGNPDTDAAADEWADAQDGMLLHMISGSTYKAYVLVVKDPSRIYVGTSSDYKSGKTGAKIFDVVKREDAVAAINAGEFYDVGGSGTGDHPIGLTYSLGSCVWQDEYTWKTFIGFDKDNNLVVSEGMTRAKADKLGIRDAVSFQSGNVLIDHDGDSVRLHYADSNTGTAQRTAIGQTADGSVILLVTDGRSASSLGATHNDVIDIMVSYGAVTAAMLDGGSSALMYYEDYYTKYNMDETKLDQYQKQGLVNKYKAFTTPRRMPTYFVVAREGGSGAEE